MKYSKFYTFDENKFNIDLFEILKTFANKGMANYTRAGNGYYGFHDVTFYDTEDMEIFQSQKERRGKVCFFKKSNFPKEQFINKENSSILKVSNKNGEIQTIEIEDDSLIPKIIKEVYGKPLKEVCSLQVSEMAHFLDNLDLATMFTNDGASFDFSTYGIKINSGDIKNKQLLLFLMKDVTNYNKRKEEKEKKVEEAFNIFSEICTGYGFDRLQGNLYGFIVDKVLSDDEKEAPQK